MNRSGTDNTLMETMVYLLIFLLFFALMFFFIISNNGEASFLEEFYAKEIALLIDSASPDMKITLDVSEISRIAVKNGRALRDLILFDNLNNKVIVGVREGSSTSFSFYNDVDIVIDSGDGFVFPTDENSATRFKFTLKEKRRDD